MTCRNEARILQQSAAAQLREVDPGVPASTDSSGTSGRSGSADPALLAPGTAVRIAVVSAAKLRRLRPMLVQRFGKGAGALVDELGSAALALRVAVSRRNVQDRDPTRGKTQRMLRDLYTALRIDARTMVLRRRLDANVMQESGSIADHSELANSVLVIVGAYRASWATLARTTRLTESELDTAEELARDLLASVARREEQRECSGSNAESERAMLHLFNVNEEVRRLVAIVLPSEQEVDRLAPSLDANRRKSPFAEAANRVFATRGNPNPRRAPATHLAGASRADAGGAHGIR